MQMDKQAVLAMRNMILSVYSSRRIWFPVLFCMDFVNMKTYDYYLCLTSEAHQMADKKSSSLGVACPYWSINDSEECGMSKGGSIYPLPQHMKMFCLTSQYIQCHHYIRGCEHIRIQEENRKKGSVITDERRKLRRFREELHLLLAVCDTKSNLRKLIRSRRGPLTSALAE
jgi:hypothetical protein